MVTRWSIYLLLGLTTNACGGQGSGGGLPVKEQLAHYAEQAHRFEFRGYDLYYNGGRVLLDQPLDYYRARFGRDTVWAISHGRILRFVDAPVKLKKGMDDIVDGITIELYYKNQTELNRKARGEPRWGYPPAVLGEDYVLIDGVPLNKDSDINAVNELLVKLDEEPFGQHIKGQSFVSRRYVTFDKGYEEGIYIWPGGVSSAYMIQYMDASTKSK